MSQPANAARTFVPFEPLPTPPGRAEDGGFRLKVVGQTESGGAPGTPGLHAHPPATRGAAGAPVVTLQREGEKVTGIRVECACGQVIELACAY